MIILKYDKRTMNILRNGSYWQVGRLGVTSKGDSAKTFHVLRNLALRSDQMLERWGTSLSLSFSFWLLNCMILDSR